MIKKIVMGLMITGTLFANNIELMQKVQKAQSDIEVEAIPIGSEALNLLQSDSNRTKAEQYIKDECRKILPNFEYLGDKKLVENIVLPNCLEFALVELKQEE